MPTSRGEGPYRAVYTAPTRSGGHFRPPADNVYDLGSATLQWRDLYVGRDIIIGNGGSLTVGHTSQETISTLDGATDLVPEVQVHGTAQADGSILVAVWSTTATNAAAPLVALVKGGNAAIGSHTIVTNNEVLGVVAAFADDGVDIETNVAQIEFVVDDGTPAADAIGGEILLRTATTGGTMTTAVTISSAQLVTLASHLVLTDSNELRLGSNSGGDARVYHDGTDMFIDLDVSGGSSGDLMIALANSFPSPDDGAVHIWQSSAGAVTGNNGLILERATETRMTLLHGNNSNAGILFGSPTSASDGQILYYGSAATPASTLAFAVSNSERLRMTASTFDFQQATTITSASNTNLTLNAQGTGDLTLQTGGVEVLRLDGGNDSLVAAVGIRIGADSGDNEIDDATQGAASTTLYIGNASIDVTSDMRVKSDRQEWAGHATELLGKLTVKDFYYDSHIPFGGIYDGKYVGLMAQDVYQIAPWAVNTQGGANCNDCLRGVDCTVHANPWTVKADLLTGLIVKSIQELDNEIVQLKQENKNLRLLIGA